MNLRLKRWITAGAALAMVSTMGLSACSSNRALTSETGKNEATMASRIPNWIFPVSAKGYTQGENGQFIQAMYRPLFAYKSTSETPYKINLPNPWARSPRSPRTARPTPLSSATTRRGPTVRPCPPATSSSGGIW